MTTIWYLPLWINLSKYLTFKPNSKFTILKRLIIVWRFIYIDSKWIFRSDRLSDCNIWWQIYYFWLLGWFHQNIWSSNQTASSPFWKCSAGYGDLYRLSIHFFLGWINSVTVTSDDKYIISGSQDKSIKIFDLGTKQLVHHFENAHESREIYVDYKFTFLDWINSLTVTSDNRYLISGSGDKSIKVFDLQTKQQVHHFESASKRTKIYIDHKFIF